MPGHISVDAEFPIFGLHDGTADREFDTFVAHTAEVGDERGVSIRRSGDAVGIEHVGNVRVVITDIGDKSPLEQTQIDTHVTVVTDFPFEVGIGIAQRRIGRDSFAVHFRYAVRFVQQHGEVTVDSRLITGKTESAVDTQVIQNLVLRHPRFVGNSP